MQLPDALLGPGLKIFLKIHHKKFLIFQEIELSCSNIFSSKWKSLKSFLHCTPSSEKKFINQETETPKESLIFSQKETVLIFQETELFYIYGKVYSER